MTLDTLYQQLFHVLSKQSITEIQKIAFAYFKQPICVTNASFELLAPNYPDVEINDLLWDIPNKQKRVPIDQIQYFFNDSLIEKVVNHPHKTILANWGRFEKNPKLTTSILINEHIAGYVAISLKDSNIPEEYYDALQIIAEALAIILQNQLSLNKTPITKKEIIARELFNGRLSKGEVETQVLNKYIKKQNYYEIIAANRDEYNTEFTEITSDLQKMPVLYTLYDQTLLILISCKDEETNDDLINLLVNLKYKCAISLPFFHLEETPFYVIQAKDALKKCKQISPNINVYDFRDYAIEILLKDLKSQATFIHPVIEYLIHYDQNHESDYFNTLKVYVEHLHQINECLELLHIHRNTLAYRLKKIEDIANIDLKDSYTLAYLFISLMIYKQNTK